jgi:hypothetical protein
MSEDPQSEYRALSDGPPIATRENDERNGDVLFSTAGRRADNFNISYSGDFRGQSSGTFYWPGDGEISLHRGRHYLLNIRPDVGNQKAQHNFCPCGGMEPRHDRCADLSVACLVAKKAAIPSRERRPFCLALNLSISSPCLRGRGRRREPEQPSSPESRRPWLRS